MNLTRLASGAVVGVFTVTGLSGCIGNDGGDNGPDSSDDCAPAEEAMETAKQRLDETAGVDIVLSTADTSDGIYIADASVTVVRPDSFTGTFTGGQGENTLDGEIVGIGDTIWAKMPIFFPEWGEVDTSEYPIPNLGALLASDNGLSAALTTTDGLSDGEAKRDENDSSQTFCYYEGTLPASAIAQIIPSADGDDYTIEYAIDGDGALRKTTLTGDPYGRGEEMTYVLDVTAYDVETEIQPPV